jgi:hypothetical protein
MKKVNFLFVVLAVVVLQSCEDPGIIQVKNNISSVKITNVKWGDHYVAWELMPGETSGEIFIDNNDEKLPSKQKVSFRMTANNKTILLETEEEYELAEGKKLLILLSDDTPVINPIN